MATMIPRIPREMATFPTGGTNGIPQLATPTIPSAVLEIRQVVSTGPNRLLEVLTAHSMSPATMGDSDIIQPIKIGSRCDHCSTAMDRGPVGDLRQTTIFVMAIRLAISVHTAEWPETKPFALSVYQ